MKTYLAKKQEVKRQWYEIDAANFTLGRLSTKVADLLHGKHKAVFTPHMDLGDNVVVVNAGKILLTGRKLAQKVYRRHSWYLGGLKTETLKKVLEKDPARVIRHSVERMLPKNRLRRGMMKRLKVLITPTHNYKIDKKISK